MTDKIKLVQGDFGHKLSITVLDASTGLPLSLTGATVRLFFRKSDSAALAATVVGTFPNGGADGRVDFTWPSGALTVAGEYVGEVEVDAVTKKQTVYDVLKFKVREQKEVT